MVTHATPSLCTLLTPVRKPHLPQNSPESAKTIRLAAQLHSRKRPRGNRATIPITQNSRRKHRSRQQSFTRQSSKFFGKRQRPSWCSNAVTEQRAGRRRHLHHRRRRRLGRRRPRASDTPFAIFALGPHVPNAIDIVDRRCSPSAAARNVGKGSGKDAGGRRRPAFVFAGQQHKQSQQSDDADGRVDPWLLAVCSMGSFFYVDNLDLQQNR